MPEWNNHTNDDEDLLWGDVRQVANASSPIRTSLGRRTAAGCTDVAALTTQVMLSVAVSLRAGDVISKVGVQFGHTAADTPTNWWFALYSNAATPAKLAQTADQTSTAIAADSFKNVALTAAQTITTDGVYYVGIMVKATTPPTLPCVAGFATSAITGALLTNVPVLAQTSGSALTATAPSTIASPTAVVNVPLVILS